MTNSAHLYNQLLDYLRQYSRRQRFTSSQGIVVDGECLNLLRQAEFYRNGNPMSPVAPKKPRVWSVAGAEFFRNERISVTALYVPLLLAALSGWQHHRLYLALDTTVLWNRALYDSFVSGLLWASRSLE